MMHPINDTAGLPTQDPFSAFYLERNLRWKAMDLQERRLKVLWACFAVTAAAVAFGVAALVVA